MLQLAAVQMTSGSKVAANLEQAARLIAHSAQGGAQLVVLPENFAVFSSDETAKVAVAEAFGAGPIQDFLATTAKRHGIVLVGGTIPIRSANPARIRAASLVFGPDGALLARYDKMHLFDVDASGSGEAYRESRTIEAGDAMSVVDTTVGRLGLAVCYDVRFPELFRALSAVAVRLHRHHGGAALGNTGAGSGGGEPVRRGGARPGCPGGREAGCMGTQPGGGPLGSGTGRMPSVW